MRNLFLYLQQQKRYKTSDIRCILYLNCSMSLGSIKVSCGPSVFGKLFATVELQLLAPHSDPGRFS